MNKKNEQLRKEAMKSLEILREGIIEELVKTKKQLCEHLEMFCKVGIDEKRYIRLKDVKGADAEAYKGFEYMDRNIVKDLKEQLEKMEPDNIVLEFIEFSQKLCTNVGVEYAKEINEIRELVDKISNIDMAIFEITL